MTKREIFNKNLLQLMNAHNIENARELAALLKLPLTSVGSWLRRGSVPRSEHLSTLCQYFKLSLNNFFNENFDVEKYKADILIKLPDGKIIAIEAKTKSDKIAEGLAQYGENPCDKGINATTCEQLSHIIKAGTEEEIWSILGHITQVFNKICSREEQGKHGRDTAISGKKKQA